MKKKSDAYLMNAGFTLMELLVTIAIVALLAGLSMAGVLSAKQRARSAQCAGNLRQQGIALEGFVADHSVYPFWGLDRKYHTLYPYDEGFWQKSILPDEFGLGSEYRYRIGAFSCPTARPPKSRIDSYSDYGYNDRGLIGSIKDRPLGLAGAGPWPERIPPVREGQVLAPSHMMAVADAADGWKGLVRDGHGTIIGRAFWVQGSVEGNRRMRKRHSGKLNVLHADGHVASLTFERMFVDESESSLALWNRDAKGHRERLTEASGIPQDFEGR